MYHSVLELCRHRNLWGDSGPGACPGTLTPSSDLYLVSDTDWCAFLGLRLVRRGVSIHLSHSPCDSGLGVAVPRPRGGLELLFHLRTWEGPSATASKRFWWEMEPSTMGVSQGELLEVWGARGD